MLESTDTTISKGWSFTQLSSDKFKDIKPDWQECKVPTQTHVELKRLGKIPDPFKALNEWAVQWVGEADWAFKTIFTVTKEQLNDPHADLVFEGLDTFCDIELNGKKIGSTANMFVHHRFEVKDALKEGDNQLHLTFWSGWNEAKKEQAAHGGEVPCWNGDSSRTYVRKSQYNWGWDWGPILMTAGPWRPIRLETYTYRIEDVRIDSDLIGPEYKTATLKASVELASSTKSTDGLEYKALVELASSTKSTDGLEYKAVLKTLEGKKVKEATFGLEESIDWTFAKGEVEAWFPIHYGKQPLYTLEIILRDKNGRQSKPTSTKVAFRHAEVVQAPLDAEPGTTFLFEVNGIRVFCGGSNWIPADNFLCEITPERYRQWVQLLVDGNQNMLRVWGGGVYEHQALYDACDEAGILVWQDFMFGCALYPSYDKLNANIKDEAEKVVKRLRNHPSVVIFAGNNEDYQVAESMGVIDYSDESGDYMHTKFPARQIYEVILPEVVKRLSNIHYHRSSPYGGVDTKDKTVGDLHQWNVWHGSQEPWANWDILKGRFVSEFGMQGYPDIRTVEEWDDDKTQLFPQSRTSVNHNKADGFERRLELYLMENFRHAFDMESYIYYTQAMQAECLAAAYRLWRREWRGRGKESTAGALVWQINDCWPCVSWAICDYYLRPKAAYYAIARELRPYTVGMARKDIKVFDDDTKGAFFSINQELQLWACNSTLKEKKAKIELVSFDLNGEEVDRQSFGGKLAPNASTEIWKGDVPGQPVRKSDAEVPRPIVVQARLLDTEDNDSVLARYSNWPEPWKYLTFPKDPKLSIKVEGDTVTLTCGKPIKGVILDLEDRAGEEVKWSDQAIDMFPGDTQVVEAKGLKGRKVKARYIGDGSA